MNYFSHVLTRAYSLIYVDSHFRLLAYCSGGCVVKKRETRGVPFISSFSPRIGFKI